MEHKLEKHPSILHADSISLLCQPLKKLNINYFSHVHVDKAGQFSGMASSAAFSEHYMKNKYYNADIHMAGIELGEYLMSDAVERCGESARLGQMAAEFGVKHCFTIIDKSADGHHFYHFATDLVDETINQVYLSNLDLLKLFIMYFNDKASQSKELSKAFEMKYSIAEDAAGFTVKDNKAIQASDRELFLQHMKIDRHISSNILKSLSFREIEILAWMHHGKTAGDIAKILKVADVTVNKHIANIKAKTHCYTPFQLGEFFAKLFHHSKDIVDHILNTKR